MPNIKAVIGGVLTGTVKENEILSTSGQLTIEDVDGEPEFMPVSGYRGNYGTLSMTKDGAWTYQTFNDIESLQEGSPAIDEFSIAAKDGTLATIAITAYGTNDAPVLASQGTSFQFYEDTVRNGEITGASDRDRDLLRYELSTGPAHGTVTLMGATYSYTPNLDYVGQDSFIIEITDGHGGNVFYTVGVELLQVNDGPVGENNTVTIDHGDSYVIKLDDFGFSDPRDAQWGKGNTLSQCS